MNKHSCVNVFYVVLKKKGFETSLVFERVGFI